MMKHLICLLLVCLGFPMSVFSQDDSDDGMIQTTTEKKEKKGRGEKYLEDQFYVGLTYDYLISEASNVVQHSLSRGIHAGFQKDLPMNERRNIGLALGVGYSYDLVYSNIFRENTSDSYHIIKNLNDLNINKNYFETHTLEFPIEFRWRTSTAQSHKFWRIYTGMRLGYVFSAKSLYKRDDITIYFNNSDLNKKWHFKVYSAFGYNTWNFFIQYNLSSILKDAKLENNTSLRSSLLQMGLIFYIL